MQSRVIPAQSNLLGSKDSKRFKSMDKNNRELENIMMKRILTKVERKDPRIQLHNASFHRTLAI